ncbi:unknown [Firmicutes bacterium CAG:822]|nr:unknown [Firmicutes bacterium CAG:822]
MNKSFLKFILVGVIILFCILSTGCLAKKSNKKMVEDFLKEYGVSNYTVSDSYKESKTKYRDPDEVWDVELNDGSDITFHVTNEYGYDEEVYSSTLTTDYDIQVVKYLFQKYGKLTNFNIVDNKITSNYNNGEELSKIFEESEQFLDYIKQSDYKVDVVFNFVFDNSKLKSFCDNEFVYNHFIRVDKKDLSFSTDDYKNIFTDYVVTVLDYRLEDNLKDVQNYSSYLNDYEYKLAYEDANGNYVYYNDLIAHDLVNITFRTLYEILKRNSYTVNGNIDNYEFATENGKCVYDDTESGNSYCLVYADNDLEYGSEINIDVVNKITGINLKIG